MRVIGWYSADGPTRVNVQKGDVYEFTVPMITRAGYTLAVGDRLEVLDRTSDTPFGEIGPRGCNWLCRTFYGDTIWSSLEQCLDRDCLRKINAQA